MEKYPTPKTEPPKEERKFNPVAEIQNLRDMRKESPEKRREAREELVENIIEQRIKIGWMVRELEHAVLTGIHNADGQDLEAARQEADKLLRPPSDMTRRAAEGLFREGLEARNLNLEDLVSAGPHERLDEKMLTDIVERGATEARLPHQAKFGFEMAVKKLAETRRAIGFLRTESGDDPTLFRVLFGRTPHGEISFIHGPHSLHVRCFDLDDYSLIYSGIYADTGARVNAEATPEQRKAAAKTGGVALWETRSDREFLEREPVALTDDGPDPARLKLFSDAMESLRGALTAENATHDASDTEAWRVFRHEERHVRNRLIGEPWAGENLGRLRDLALKIHATEADIDRQLLVLRDLRDDDQTLTAGDARGHILNERLDSLVRAAESVIARHAEQTVEDMAKDEILAYYADNELEDAVGRIRNGGRARPRKERPYMRRSRSEGGLYDFHGGNLAKEAERAATATVTKTAYEEDLTLSGMGETDLDTSGLAKRSRGLLEANVGKLVRQAIAEHKKNYDGLLDRSVEAIALLERRGYSSQEVSDILTVEPLRNWLAMAERITGEREKRRKA